LDPAVYHSVDNLGGATPLLSYPSLVFMVNPAQHDNDDDEKGTRNMPNIFWRYFWQWY